MVIYAYFTHDGNDFYSYNQIKIKKTVSDTNVMSSFEIKLDNIDGLYATTFEIGDEIVFYADKNTNPPTTKFFTGVVEDINFNETLDREFLTLSGTSAVDKNLKDSLIEPEVYNTTEVSAIVTDIFDKYTSGLTRTNVNVTLTTLDHIRFANTSVNDGFIQLAELSGFFFYGDANKDLHFEEKNTVSSGLTFDNTNVIKTTFNKKDGTDFFNEIFVYGGMVKTGFTETFIADGGSVFDVSYKPSNTKVTSSGIVLKGAVAEMTSIPGSGQEFLVDYDGKRVIITSGTECGFNIPGSLSPVIVDYQRETPIAKYGINRDSIDTYKIKKTKVIIDKNIDSPQQALDILQNQLDLYSDPSVSGTLNVDGVFEVTPGQTCVVDFPYNNISSQTYTIIQATYNFIPKKMMTDEVLSIRVNKRSKDITDSLKQLILDVKKLQAGEVLSADVMTRLESATGSFGIRVSEWNANTWTNGSKFVLSSPEFGRLGAVTGTQPYLAGSFAKTWTTQVSGGEV